MIDSSGMNDNTQSKLAVCATLKNAVARVKGGGSRCREILTMLVKVLMCVCVYVGVSFCVSMQFLAFTIIIISCTRHFQYFTDVFSISYFSTS